MLIRQIRTARAGMTPNPRERRHTALRWFGPKLRFEVESGVVVERDGGEHEHPVEYERYKRRDHETQVEHAFGREDEPAILSFLGDCATLGLLRSRNGSTWVLSSDPNPEYESIDQKRQPSSCEL